MWQGTVDGLQGLQAASRVCRWPPGIEGGLQDFQVGFIQGLQVGSRDCRWASGFAGGF